MLAIVDNWDFRFDEESIASTVYSFALLNFQKSLFHKYESDPVQRSNFVDGYLQNFFTERLFKEINEHGSQTKLNNLCAQAYPEYSGPDHCAYNIARGFAEVKDQLTRNLSGQQENWIWRNVHYNAYKHLPFSMTPLKFIFHRTTASEGNFNTVNVSKFGWKNNYNSTKTIESTHAANYKSVMQLDPDEKK